MLQYLCFGEKGRVAFDTHPVRGQNAAHLRIIKIDTQLAQDAHRCIVNPLDGGFVQQIVARHMMGNLFHRGQSGGVALAITPFTPPFGGDRRFYVGHRISFSRIFDWVIGQ